jgi:AmiR/NasT family two-component response regulator
MKRPRPVMNFRGLHALLLLPDDQNLVILQRALQRLGLSTQALDPSDTKAIDDDGRVKIDIVFADADAWTTPSLPAPMEAYPVVALIGHETPTRLLRSHEMAADTFLLKPLKAEGVFTAIFFAVSEHRQQCCLENRIAELNAKQAARRHVIKAILLIMDRFGLDDDEAYRRLRRESMSRRMSIEDLSRAIVADADKLASRRLAEG